MSTRWGQEQAPRGADYDDRFERLAAAGHDVHGEANFVAGYRPHSVLDAGCGTGRVSIELARRGLECAGIDADPNMLARAQEKTTDVEWYLGDISKVDVRNPDDTSRRFHCVLAAGNVMIFLEPGSERRTVANLARHLVPGGLLIAGFQLLPGRYSLDDYESDCAAAGLEPHERCSTWQREPWTPESGYVVAVHRKPLAAVVPEGGDEPG